MWDENWDVLCMFLRMQTQWTVSMAGYVGLRYDILLGPGGLFDLYSIEDRRSMLEDLQVMERAALSTFAKSREPTNG